MGGTHFVHKRLGGAVAGTAVGIGYSPNPTRWAATSGGYNLAIRSQHYKCPSKCHTCPKNSASLSMREPSVYTVPSRMPSAGSLFQTKVSCCGLAGTCPRGEGAVPKLGRLWKTQQKNGGRSALYVLLLGACFGRQSTGRVSHRPRLNQNITCFKKQQFLQ